MGLFISVKCGDVIDLRNRKMYALHIGNNVSKVLLRWKLIKLITLQHKDEICLSVNVVERQKEVIR
jgi:hypothetical protein